MTYADRLLEPWAAALLERLPSVRVFDCHTHVGDNDPSGFSASLADLTESLALVDGRAAVFPLKEPDGYREPNLEVAAAAQDSDGRLVAFARIDPADEPVARAEEALAAGAVGLKLHPDGEEFDLADDRLDPLYELADAERLPVIVHAGPELEGLGRTALNLLERHPGMRMILAHGALTDLGWIHREVDRHPNLFFDTSWWGPSHLMALLSLVPPGRILSASDLPYCTPLSGFLTTARCALQAGLTEEQIAAILGGQFERLIAREEPLDLGPASAARHRPVGPLLERLFVTLLTGVEAMQRGEGPGNALAVARHGCKAADDDPDRGIYDEVSLLLDLYEDEADGLDDSNPYAPGWDLFAAAAIIARTPAASRPDDVREVTRRVADGAVAG